MATQIVMDRTGDTRHYFDAMDSAYGALPGNASGRPRGRSGHGLRVAGNSHGRPSAHGAGVIGLG
jgi:hypothetical protein